TDRAAAEPSMLAAPPSPRSACRLAAAGFARPRRSPAWRRPTSNRQHAGVSSLLLAIVDKTDRNRPAGDCLAQPFAEVQGRAALERGGNGMQVNLPDFRGSAVADIGHPRRGDDVAAALEGKSHRHLHAGTGLLLRGRNPAGAERVEHAVQRVELVLA